ncbi:MAG: phosphonate C-P lyase system protein PhnL [Planctomycetota bacterium]
MDQPLIQVERLAKSFQVHAQSARIQAVADLSFALHAGRITALAGPSGAGKSSVLKCLHRTYLPTSGHIWLAGEPRIDLASCDDHTVLRVRQERMGFVTQFLHCLPRLSAIDVVAAPLIRQGCHGGEARERAVQLLRELAIPERLWKLAPATFSGGEKQRVNIARGFVRRNEVLLLDEPTASLDDATAERVVALITAARAAGTAIIAIWHDRDLVERLADTVVELRRLPTRPEVATCQPT